MQSLRAPVILVHLTMTMRLPLLRWKVWPEIILIWRWSLSKEDRDISQSSTARAESFPQRGKSLAFDQVRVFTTTLHPDKNKLIAHKRPSSQTNRVLIHVQQFLWKYKIEWGIVQQNPTDSYINVDGLQALALRCGRWRTKTRTYMSPGKR